MSSNITQPRRYMSKRQRPCDFCRARKTACRIDQSPPCRLCVLHGRECTFIEAAAPRKRTVPADGPHAGQVDASVDASTRRQTVAPSPGQVLGGFSVGQLPEDGPMHFGEVFNFDTTQSEFEAMFRSPRPPDSPSAAALETEALNMSIASAPNSGYPAGANPQLMGLSSDMDPLLIRHYRFDEMGMFAFKELAIHSVQHSPLPCQFLISQQSLFSRRREEEAGLSKGYEDSFREELQQVIPLDVGRRLVRLFYQFIHPKWPIFSESHPLDPESAPLCLVAATYAISLPFAVHDDKLSVDVAYDKPPYAELSRIIEKSLAYEMHSPTLAIVQALLLLVLRPSSDPMVADTASRWDLLGRLTSCATTLGLHLDPSRWSMASWQISHRRRLSFIIYATDKWLACGLGRPPLIHEDNWLVTTLRYDDFSDSGLDAPAQNHLINFSAITRTLASTLSKLYSPRTIGILSGDHEGTIDVAQPLLHELRNIPNDDSSTSSTENGFGQLYVELIIGRAKLRPWLTETATTEYHSHDLSRSLRVVREEMRTCIIGMSAIIRSLSPDTDGGFWPPWTQFMFSSICFTLMTMAVTSAGFEEASGWIAELQSTRKLIRVKVVSFPFLRLGLLRIDALFWRGIENVLQLKPHVADAFKAAESERP
ncbi:hypothetical protein CGMCC3_g16733 [Colletotrichum fructicola]|nr:uncharacterized protein CGMCC3_g16733 [Colletotrichum fructicola]KAE9567120.1 hypothetical protein CGMCC3_g16733 [Colletotrichum fructicola]